MTREEMLELLPGSTLDSLVAEKVMGWMIDDEAFCPSTDMSAAWEVVEKFMDMEISKNGSDYVASMDHPGFYVQAKSAPEAICKAALLAVMDA